LVIRLGWRAVESCCGGQRTVCLVVGVGCPGGSGGAGEENDG